MRFRFPCFILLFFFVLPSAFAENHSYTLKRVDSIKIGKKLTQNVKKSKQLQTALKYDQTTKTWKPTKNTRLYRFQNIFILLKSAKKQPSTHQIVVSSDLGDQIHQNLLTRSDKVIITPYCTCDRSSGVCSMTYDQKGNPLHCEGTCSRCKTVIDIYANPGVATVHGKCGTVGP